MNLFMLGVEDKLNDNRIIRLGKMIDWSKFRKMLTGVLNYTVNSVHQPIGF
jgi:malate/lactate dehydrogenase